jgi:hypothetical protein
MDTPLLYLHKYYFFNLEKKNGQNKLWKKIRGLDGNLKYDIDEILDEQINFYANLFISDKIHL